MAGVQWPNGTPDEFFKKRFAQGLIALIADVDARAKRNAPIKTGALKSSGRWRSVGDYVVEQFGSARVNYAAKRERGPNRDPSTEHYLEHAARDVSNGDIAQYFK